MRKLVLVVVGLSIIMPLYGKKPKRPDPGTEAEQKRKDAIIALQEEIKGSKEIQVYLARELLRMDKILDAHRTGGCDEESQQFAHFMWAHASSTISSRALILCSIKTIFIDGNNQSANILRKKWQERTHMRVVKSLDEADAILEVSQVNIPYEATRWSREVGNQVFTIVILKDKAGKQLWTGTGANSLFAPEAEDSTDSILCAFINNSGCK